LHNPAFAAAGSKAFFLSDKKCYTRRFHLKQIFLPINGTANLTMEPSVYTAKIVTSSLMQVYMHIVVIPPEINITKVSGIIQ
jgi:hypothetical protein